MAQRPTVMKSVKIGEGLHPAAHFMDVMTHPDFRRRGLFTRLVHRATEEVVEQGATICYTFPNENSFPGYAKKTDWTHVGSLPLFMKPIDVDALLRWQVENRPLQQALGSLLRPVASLVCREERGDHAANIGVQRLTAFDRRFDAFWEQTASDYEVILRRDSRHLNWRYMERPSVDYVAYAAEAGESLRGFIVVRTRQMFGLQLGMIVDLLTLDQDQRVAQALIAEGSACLKQAGADAIGCLMFDHQPYCDALRREGFIRVPDFTMPREFYFLARVNRDEPALQKALESENWFLTWGDNDAV